MWEDNRTRHGSLQIAREVGFVRRESRLEKIRTARKELEK